MLAKVIAWARTREEAIARLDSALADTVVLGVSTNIEFLRGLLADPDVKAGNLDTSLIERVLPGLSFQGPDARLLAAAALVLHGSARPLRAVWERPSGWRIGGPRVPSRYSLRSAPPRPSTCWWPEPPNGRPSPSRARSPWPPSLIDSAPGRYSVEIDGRIDRLGWPGRGRACGWGRTDTASNSSAQPGRPARRPIGGITGRTVLAAPDIRSPMPGTVVAVNVANGDTVEEGQTLLIVEAMKMEHQLTASVSGVVSINVTPGDVVRLDQIVATITPHEEPGRSGSHRMKSELIGGPQKPLGDLGLEQAIGYAKTQEGDRG